jgi:hypothetical protein
MKPRLVLGGLLAGALVAFLATHYEPRRARPVGWDSPWAALTLEPESSWAVDRLERTVVQHAFVEASQRLTECSQEYGRTKQGGVEKLEVLLETRAERTSLQFVVSAGESPFLTCITRALEHTAPVPTPGVTDTHWRLGLDFLIPTLDELVSPPWWAPLVPDSLRSGGSSPIYVG